MAEKWSVREKFWRVRNAASFTPFPSVFPDSQGTVTQWLGATRIIPLWAREWKSPGICHVAQERIINDSMWFCFPNGQGTVLMGYENKSFRFEPGDLILIPQGVIHTVRLERGVSEPFMSVHFNAYVFGSMNLLDLLRFPFHIPFSQDAPYKSASHKLAREFAIQAPG